jgi:hypothetical protein
MKYIPTFEQYINEKYNILNESSKISWDKKQGLIMVGRKK